MDNNDKLITIERLKQFWSKFRVGESYLEDRNKGEIFNDYQTNKATASYSHAEGYNTSAFNTCSHAEGQNTAASGSSSHAEGQHTTAYGNNSHAEGGFATASGSHSHAEGNSTSASGNSSHAEGQNTTAYGSYSHSEGQNTTAYGNNSHAEGFGYYITSIISGEANSLTYTFDTPFTGQIQFVKYARYNNKIVEIISIDNNILEVKNTLSDIPLSKAFVYLFSGAIGPSSHVEGSYTLASGYYSHAEGYNTSASGNSSHAEGNKTTASGSYSHAEGYNTTASGEYSHAEGKYNIIDTNNQYAHIIGNGTGVNARSNAYTVDWYGNAWYKGKVYIGGSSQDDGLELTGTTVNYFDSYNLTSTWNNSTAPFTQVIQINGILPDDRPIVDIRYSGIYTNDKAYDEEWGKIYRAVSDENQLTFYAHEKTTGTIPIRVMVVRQNG
jgi:hypothetical protein